MTLPTSSYQAVCPVSGTVQARRGSAGKMIRKDASSSMEIRILLGIMEGFLY